jgi:hypothetical protein
MQRTKNSSFIKQIMSQMKELWDKANLCAARNKSGYDFKRQTALHCSESTETSFNEMGFWQGPRCAKYLHRTPT